MKKITGDAEEKGNLGQFPFSDIQELHTERWRGVGGGFYVSLLKDLSFCNKL